MEIPAQIRRIADEQKWTDQQLLEVIFDFHRSEASTQRLTSFLKVRQDFEQAPADAVATGTPLAPSARMHKSSRNSRKGG